MMRLFAWSTARQGDRIVDGITLLPLTFAALIDLKLASCPLITGGKVGVEAALAYLWRNSSVYQTAEDRQESRMLFDLLLVDLGDEHLVQLCRAHIEVAFLETPFEGSFKTSAMPPVEPLLTQIYTLCQITNMQPEQLLNWSVAKGHSMLRAHYRATDSKWIAPVPDYLKYLENQGVLEIQRILDEAGKEFE